GGGPEHRDGLRPDARPRGPPAGGPHGGPAPHQRLHRPHQEHLRGRRLLRRQPLQVGDGRHPRPRRQGAPHAAVRGGAVPAHHHPARPDSGVHREEGAGAAMSASVLYDAPGPKARRRSVIGSVIGTIAIFARFWWMIATLAAPRVAANGAVTPGMFDYSRWDVLENPLVWLRFLDGVGATLLMAGAAAILAILIGIGFSFVRTARSAWVRVPATVV